MEEKTKFEICRSINNDLCVTADSLDYILAKTMHGYTLGLKPEDQDLVRAVLNRIRYDLNCCIIDFIDEELRGEDIQIGDAMLLKIVSEWEKKNG